MLERQREIERVTNIQKPTNKESQSRGRNVEAGMRKIEGRRMRMKRRSKETRMRRTQEEEDEEERMNKK